MEQQSPKRVVLQPRDTRYAREQKAAFALVGITGGLAVLLGIFFLLDHVRSPLNMQYVGPRLLTAAEKQREELEKQSVTDTDGDGLTDFEELYNYRTSPYLRDTDGDGMTDGLEIAAGTDPSCAEGDDCEVPALDFNSGIQDLDDAQNIPTTEADILVSQIENLTPFQIRQLLVQNGADPDTLSQIPDAQLKSAFSETLTELYQSGQLQQFLENLPEEVSPPAEDSQPETDPTNQDTTTQN